MKKNYFLLSLITLLSTFLNAQTSNALQFDGYDDVIQIDNITTATFTLEALIKTSANSPTGSVAYEGVGILDSDVGGGADDFIFSILNNKLSFWDGNVEVNINGNIDICDGNWHHVAVVREANVGYSLYVDGVLDAQQSSSSMAVLNANPHIFIGAAFTDSRYLNGAIAEVRIWNTARTTNEINTNKANELILPQNGLVSYYKFNQGTAGDDNSSEFMLNDALNINNGILINFDLNGTSSNWIADNTLSVGNFNSALSTLKLFPNPSSDFIRITGLSQTENFKIYNVLGSVVKSGIVDSNTKINIQDLTNGVFFLKLPNGATTKFLKQ